VKIKTESVNLSETESKDFEVEFDLSEIKNKRLPEEVKEALGTSLAQSAKGVKVKNKYYVKVRLVESGSCKFKFKCEPLKLKIQIVADEDEIKYENIMNALMVHKGKVVVN